MWLITTDAGKAVLGGLRAARVGRLARSGPRRRRTRTPAGRGAGRQKELIGRAAATRVAQAAATGFYSDEGPQALEAARRVVALRELIFVDEGARFGGEEGAADGEPRRAGGAEGAAASPPAGRRCFADRRRMAEARGARRFGGWKGGGRRGAPAYRGGAPRARRRCPARGARVGAGAARRRGDGEGDAAGGGRAAASTAAVQRDSGDGEGNAAARRRRGRRRRLGGGWDDEATRGWATRGGGLASTGGAGFSSRGANVLQRAIAGGRCTVDRVASWKGSTRASQQTKDHSSRAADAVAMVLLKGSIRRDELGALPGGCDVDEDDDDVDVDA